MRVIQPVFRFLFGNVCLGCREAKGPLDPWLCPDCRAELRRLGREPLHPAPDVLCLYPMASVTRNLVHALKYGAMPGLANYFVRNSSIGKDGEARNFFKDAGIPLLWLPVPLHSSRFRERGYNQAERIARALALNAGGQVGGELSRTVFQGSQTKLSAQERVTNVAGVFRVSPHCRFPEGPFLPVVVDDVYTTGATTGACLYALSEAKVRAGKVCTLIYEEGASATMDYAADNSVEWE
jgi:predicted amidophosphoribosyltransferase